MCTLISENQGLEKSRSISNPRKVSGFANLIFFQVRHLDFFQCRDLEKKFVNRHEHFGGFEKDLDFSRPCFSEIKVLIKSLIYY